MERIKLALEKARQQGLAGGLVDRGTGSKGRGDAVEPLEISYVRTDVVELSTEHLERNRILAYNKNHPSSWMFDILRTQVLQKMEQNNWRTLAVTSPNPEAGKTVVAINLAMSIAHQTQRTSVLVDFDLRRPMVANYLGIHREKSLNDVLEGSADIAEAMVNPNLPRLTVVPANKAVEKSSELLSSRRVQKIINELRDRYQDRVVIFDLPPVLSADDALAVLPKIDCVLVVVGNGMSSKREIEDSLRHLSQSNVVGVVLNKSEMPMRGHHHY